MGMETCMTLGMLSPAQADMLADAGLDYYNHNIDTSPERYNEIITTRTMEDRLDTLAEVRRAGINVCSGGIVGMGETRADRDGRCSGRSGAYHINHLASQVCQQCGRGSPVLGSLRV